MPDTYWILAPVKVQSSADWPATQLIPDSETIRRALEGHKFESAEMAMAWLELIGYPEEESSAEGIAAPESEKE